MFLHYFSSKKLEPNLKKKKKSKTFSLSPLSCWMSETHYHLILSIPVVLSMVLNLFFMLNIIRVLATKLTAITLQDDDQSAAKKVKRKKFKISVQSKVKNSTFNIFSSVKCFQRVSVETFQKGSDKRFLS